MEMTADIGGLIGGLATAFSLYFLWRQIKSQNEQLKKQIEQNSNQEKRDRLEIVMRLYSDYFNNDNFQRLFEVIDQNNLGNSERELKVLIETGRFMDIREVHLSQFMNFFNSLAILTEEGIVAKHQLLKMFQYQLEKTFSHLVLIEYIDRYGLGKIKDILPDTLFVYGTLMNQQERKNIPDLLGITNYLANSNDFELDGFTLVELEFGSPYKAMVKSGQDDKVLGSILKISEKANWTEVFTNLDNYEEVNKYYDRRIIRLNKTDEYSWVYLKKTL
jgi:gamma-glutamylcyclotransferase (GGCT)/AIG2-like uncharacterized protein YtfP